MKLPDVFVELQRISKEFFVTPLLSLKEPALSNTIKEDPEEGSYIACAAVREMIIDSALR